MKAVNLKLNFENKDMVSKESDKYELFVDALLSEKGEKTYIYYDDSKLLDIEETKTTIIFTENEMSINRKGAINTKLRFRLGDTITCNYRTTHLDILIDVVTKKLDIKRTEDSLKIDLLYYFKIQGEKVSENNFVMEVVFPG